MCILLLVLRRLDWALDIIHNGGQQYNSWSDRNRIVGFHNVGFCTGYANYRGIAAPYRELFGFHVAGRFSLHRSNK